MKFHKPPIDHHQKKNHVILGHHEKNYTHILLSNQSLYFHSMGGIYLQKYVFITIDQKGHSTNIPIRQKLHVINARKMLIVKILLIEIRNLSFCFFF